MDQKQKNKIQKRRIVRTRGRIRGTNSRPRLAVFRSNKSMSVQLIDDESGNTLASAMDNELKGKGTKTEISKKLGELIAKKAGELKIKSAVLDRRSYRYHGRVRALADGAREGGLNI